MFLMLPLVYCKPTFSGIYTHCDRFLPSSNKIALLHTLDVSELAQIGLSLKTITIANYNQIKEISQRHS